MDADGSHLTQITHNEHFDGDPAFSPDGTKLVVVRNRGDDEPDILVIIRIGSGRERFLTKGFEPMWSPSGSRIASDRAHRAGNVEVNTIRPAGGCRRRLTHSPGFDGSPNWSPDGARIAFASERSGNNDIYIMAADGADPVRLTRSPRPEILPAWAPAGNRIAFTRARDDEFTQTDIYTVRTTGEDVSRITTARGLDLDADWGVVD